MNVLKLFVRHNKSGIKTKYVWMVLCIIMFVTTVFYCSGDLGATASHGIYLWESIFSGNFFLAYSDFIQNPLTIIAYYTPSLYFLFAVWNFPVYILYKLGMPFLRDITILTFGVMIWNKILLFLFIFLMIWAIDNIAQTYQISDVNRKMLSFSVASSFLVIYPSLIMGQYDVISAAISLFGISAYLKNEEKKFMIAFMIASGFKFFSILIYIPLILLEEKNILKVAVKSSLALFIPILSKVLFCRDVAYTYVGEFSKQKTFSLLEKTVPGNYSAVPIVAILLIGVCIFAYVTSSERKKDYTIYLSFAVFGIMFCFMAFGPYWIILIAPYAILICFLNLGKDQKTSANFLMVFAIEISMCILTLYYHHDNLDYALLYRGLLYNKLKFRPPAFSVYGFVQNHGLGTYVTCIAGVFITCIFCLFIINLPSKQKEVVKLYEQELAVHDRWTLYIKSLVTVLFMGVTILCFVVPFKLSYNFLELSYNGKFKEEPDGYYVLEESSVTSKSLVLQPGEYDIEIIGEGLAAEGMEYYVQDYGEFAGAHDFHISDDKVKFMLSIPQYSEDIKIVINTKDNQIKIKKMKIMHSE